VLAAATLLDGIPERLAVVGIEPESTEGLRVGLTAPVDTALGAALAEATRVLAAWGSARALRLSAGRRRRRLPAARAAARPPAPAGSRTGHLGGPAEIIELRKATCGVEITDSANRLGLR